MWKGHCALLSMALAAVGPASAQTSDRHLGEALLTTATALPRSPPPSRCRDHEGQTANGEIVVCGTDNKEQRIPSTGDSDPTSRVALRNGELHPPQLGKESCRGKLGCFIGGLVSPPPYIIDLKAIPEAPKDSDADRIAKGEMAQP
jgi:hypothetical protein